MYESHSPKIESKETITLPEWIANPPLENTSLVYSVPVYGEWKNGQTLRMLHAMFAQKIEHGQALEIQLITNRGNSDYYLHTEVSDSESKSWKEKREEASKKINETESVVEFVRKIVDIQALAQQCTRTSKKGEKIAIKKRIDEIISSVEDPIQKDVLHLAVKRSNEISIALINAIQMDFERSPYKHASLSSARTLGIDAAMARFAGNEDLPISMFDVDTVPLDTHTVRDIQRMYASDSKLNYIFFSMSDSVKGVSRTFASDPNMGRHALYNRDHGHGSPQQSFRLRAYRKLQEIASFMMIGDEDRDTGIRLMYHLGKLQDGLLLETSKTISPSSPRVLTADRQDGFVDGNRSEKANQERAAYDIERDIHTILNFRDEVMKKISELPERDQQEAREILTKARKEELRRERVQQRMNRVVVKAFFAAIEQGWIQIQNDETRIEETKLTALPGGKALQFFLRMNPTLITEILHSPDDQAAMKYYAGLSDELPPRLEHPTHFQQAMRDYLGDVASCDELASKGLLTDESPTEQPHRVVDQRQPASRYSFWHGMTAELLSLGHTYRVFFETKDFIDARSDYRDRWPERPEEQKLEWHFEPMDDRVRILQDQLATQQTTQPTPAPQVWYERFSFNSFPGLEALRRLLRRDG